MIKKSRIERYVMPLVAMVLLVAATFTAVAEEQDIKEASTPHQVVEQVTADIMGLVRANDALLESSPEEFYTLIGDALQEVVAFDYIARGVMGRYAKQATLEQRQRFSDRFQNDLITTYAKGMVSFSDYSIRVEPPAEAIGEESRISVLQKVSSAEGENTVLYSMGKSKKSGHWMLLNVVINGVNLGTTFRSQFSQAVKTYDGDLEAVINTWSNKS